MVGQTTACSHVAIDSAWAAGMQMVSQASSSQKRSTLAVRASPAAATLAAKMHVASHGFDTRQSNRQQQASKHIK